MAPRWRKVTADITARPGRSALAVVAMTIGVSALGTLAFKNALVRPILASMHGATQPASAVFYVDAVDDSLVAVVNRVPGVGAAEARPLIMARVRVGEAGDEEWVPAALYVIRDFEAQQINVFDREDGAWPPGSDEILLEREAVKVARCDRDDELVLRIPGANQSTLRFTGTVHAPGLAPAWMEHMVYGFIRWDSRVRDSEHRESAQLLIRVAEHALELGHITEVADRVQAEIEAQGYSVRRRDIPTPGRHPHADQMDTFLYLLGTFALLAFALSVALVASMIHTLQSEQVKQIGMMKAIGATRAQVAAIYLVHVGLLAGMALCLGVPIAWFAGSAYARFAAGILNADASHSPFPFPTLIALCVIGLLVPMLAALTPVWRGSRVSVREALADVADSHVFGSAQIERWLTHTARLPRLFALVLRNALACRGRIALTVGMLGLGGAMFMAAVNVSSAWTRAATRAFERVRYDLLVQFPEPRPVAELDSVFGALPSIASAEYWPSQKAFLIGASGAPGRELTLLGVDPSSQLLEPRFISGGWLDAARPYGVVTNERVREFCPGLRAGDSLFVRVKGRTLGFSVSGVTKGIWFQPLVYVPQQTLLVECDQTGTMTRAARIVTREQGEAAERAAARDVQNLFDRMGIEVQSLHRMDDLRGAVLDHLVIVKLILSLAAAVVVLVAAIGLTSTLAVNVIQRTREIGIMSAIGATPRQLALLVWGEALLVAVVSWLAALVTTAPISYALQLVTGRMFFRTPLEFTMTSNAALFWLLLILVLASISSMHPARRAAHFTVREAINHV